MIRKTTSLSINMWLDLNIHIGHKDVFFIYFSGRIPVCCQLLRVSSVRKALFVGCSLQMIQQLVGINTVM